MNKEEDGMKGVRKNGKLWAVWFMFLKTQRTPFFSENCCYSLNLMFYVFSIFFLEQKKKKL